MNTEAKPEPSQEAIIETTAIAAPATTSTSTAKTTAEIDVGVEATTLPPIDSKDQVLEAADDMFNNLQQYISSEIELTLDDYKLLEAMNNTTAEKYHEMRQVAANTAESISELNAKYEQILPKLEIIDKLDRKVTHLEKLAYAIDSYSKRLEKQYKQLEKRATTAAGGSGAATMDGSL